MNILKDIVMKRINNIFFCMAFFIIMFSCRALSAQSHAGKLTCSDYLMRVTNGNIAGMAEKYNVEIASANLQAARALNNPQLSFSYADNQDNSKKMGKSYEAGLEYSFYVGGVRTARIKVAGSEKKITEENTRNYFVTLLADASNAFVEAVRLKRLFNLALSSYKQIRMMAFADSLRFASGEITRTDAIQSGLEADAGYNDFLRGKGSYERALSALYLYMGEESGSSSMYEIDTNLTPLIIGAGKYAGVSEEALLDEAEKNRADLLAAFYAKELSNNNLRLIKANRSIELGLSAGISHNNEVRNTIAPAPSYNGFTVGLTLPIKLSSANRGEVRAAQFQQKQAEKAYEAAYLQVRQEVRVALINYAASLDVFQRYKGKMLIDAEEIVKNKIFGYTKGESSLLEVIIARRSFNDACAGYINAECDLAIAANELGRAVGELQLSADR
jgi:outer membrane protein, heavy metal efflux system